MPTTYLFRIDMNKDNDAFFNMRKASASHVYAGIAMGIGSSSDWIPDLVEVIISEPKKIKLRLIELEAYASNALISSRKYLPENSTGILRTFCEYLKKAIKDCHSRADSRENDFLRLEEILLKTEEVYITSAGALRSAAEFVEELPLIDQPKNLGQIKSAEKTLREDASNFYGVLKLSRDRAEALGRAILILDAVIRQEDHRDTAFRSWRGQERCQPLKKYLKKNGISYPSLRAFVSKKSSSGVTLDFEKILSDLANIWKLNPEDIRNHINGFFPFAAGIAGNDRMPVVFEKARGFLSKN